MFPFFSVSEQQSVNMTEEGHFGNLGVTADRRSVRITSSANYPELPSHEIPRLPKFFFYNVYVILKVSSTNPLNIQPTNLRTDRQIDVVIGK